MALDVSDPAIKITVDAIRDDRSETNWLHLGYDGKNKIKVLGSGSGGFDEFRSQLKDDTCSWGYLRLVSGDQESKRVKFVFVVWAGQGVGAMAKSRFVAHKPSVTPAVGQFHVEVFADDPADFTLDIVMDKLKRAGGANYDLGSNAKGYSSSVGSIKSGAAAAYKTAEKETTIGAVQYSKGPLGGATPCDLGGRRMVAPPTEAKKNINLVGNLDATKIAVEGASPVPAAAVTPTTPKKDDEEAARKKAEADAAAKAAEEAAAQKAADEAAAAQKAADEAAAAEKAAADAAEAERKAAEEKEAAEKAEAAAAEAEAAAAAAAEKTEPEVPAETTPEAQPEEEKAADATEAPADETPAE